MLEKVLHIAEFISFFCKPFYGTTVSNLPVVVGQAVHSSPYVSEQEFIHCHYFPWSLWVALFLFAFNTC